MFKSSVRHRLAALMALAIIPLLATIAIVIAAQQRQLMSGLRQEGLGRAEGAAARFSHSLRNAQLFLSFMTQIDSVRRLQPIACTDFLQRLQATDSTGQIEMYVADTSGRIICSATPGGALVNVSDRKYFQRALSGGDIVTSEFALSRATGRPSLMIGRPIRTETGELAGVAIVAYSEEWLQQHLSGELLSEGDTIAVIDESGLVLAARPVPKDTAGITLVPQDRVRDLLGEDPSASVLTGPDGAERLYAFHKLSRGLDTGHVYLAFGRPTTVVTSQVYRGLTLVVAVVLIFVLYGSAVIVFGGNRLIVQPLQALVGAVDKLRSGVLDARVRLPGNMGEFSMLGDAFDQMASSLETRQREVEQAREQYRRLAENAPDVIYRWHLVPERRLDYINPAVTELTGYTVSEYYEDPELIRKIIEPDDVPLFQEAMMRPDSSPAVDLIVRERHKDGRLIWVHHRMVRVMDESGRVAAIEGIARDVTRQKESEEALKLAKDVLEDRVRDRTAELEQSNSDLRRLSSILEATTDFVGMADAAGRVLFVNAAGRRMLGVPRDEDLTGQPIFVLHPEWAQLRISQNGLPAAAAEGSWVGETALLTRDGREIPVSQVILTHKGEDGEIEYFSTIARDISERLVAEEQVRKAKEEAERASSAKSDFLSSMSHELRTPLNAIIGFSQVLLGSTLTPEDREGLEYILKAGRHLLRLINDFLDISRIEAGRMTISTEPVHAVDVVHEVLALLAPMAEEQQVRIRAADVLGNCFVMADRHRLIQVLMNLLSNAIKYNRRGGSAEISCGPDPGGLVRISVADTGYGIPADRLKRLFTPFDRLGAEERTIEGIGLGLALSKRLVELMRGRVGVESVVGEGSRFWIDLPPAKPQAETTPATARSESEEPSSEAVAGAPTILYAEDNLSNVRLVEFILAKRPGLRLMVASQGSMCLDLARQHRPALILLDLHLPDMNGQQVLHRLKSDPTTASIPVVIISADAFSSRIQRLLNAGAMKYLTKPIDVNDFLQTLDEILRAD